MNDRIGFDPLRWVERLRDVNLSSEFTPKQKMLIERHLYLLSCELEDAKRTPSTDDRPTGKPEGGPS